MPECDFGSQPNSITLEFWGDHKGHVIDIEDDVAHLEWDNTSRVLTGRFTYGAEAVAQEMYWRLLEIVPALRGDRR